jgi:hypothetical protein
MSYVNQSHHLKLYRVVSLDLAQPPPLAFADLEEFHSNFIGKADKLRQENRVSVD